MQKWNKEGKIPNIPKKNGKIPNNTKQGNKNTKQYQTRKQKYQTIPNKETYFSRGDNQEMDADHVPQ